MKNFFSIIICLYLLSSCSVDKINLSPIAGNFVNITNGTQQNLDFATKTEFTVNASEITNLLADFPRINNEKINKEVVVMKFNINEYIYATQAYNLTGKVKAQKNFENSYKKLQKLKSNLKPDEEEVLNRYLVKIKTSIGILENANISK